MRSSDDPLGRAEALYELSVTRQRTQAILDLLDQSAAETAARTATTVLCQYLNHWDGAEPAELARAEAAIAAALAHNPQLYLAHYAKGFLCRTRGQHQDAVNAFDETIRYAPEFARAYAQKGEDLVFLGRPAEAVAQVERALEINPNSSVRGYFYWVIGHARFAMKEDDNAITWLQRSIRMWPDVWYNRLYLVSAHAHSNNRAAASRVLRAFYRHFPGYTFAHVIDSERVVPYGNEFIVAERERFHEGLRLAGMT
jgi:adenylate cyclase